MNTSKRVHAPVEDDHTTEAPPARPPRSAPATPPASLAAESGTGLRVLFCTAEAEPLVKVGGLGEVSGALPPALRQLGLDVRLLLPAYQGLIDAIGGQAVGPLFQPLPGVNAPAQLVKGALPNGAPVYAVDCPSLYDREGSPYSDRNGDPWPDNALRFGVLGKVAALFGTKPGLADWTADIVHCNDWHTGLAPAYLAHDSLACARSVISIHNIAYQGVYPPELLPALGLPKSCFIPDGVEFYGQLSFLKAGLYYADAITTVSPGYAREIQTAAGGYGLEGLLAYRHNRLTGILNGIDTAVWDPSRDAYLAAHFGPTDMVGKAVNKQLLQERLGLKVSPETVMLALISRFTAQKGVDLALEVARELLDVLDEPVQLAVLGSGERHYELDWTRFAWDYPGRVSVTIGYDEPLAHLLEAGADIFLMPSRFEPCGLNQMYSMRYGTPPVAHRVGGLADSVVDATPRTLAAGTATGFVFENASKAELLACVLRALLAWQDRKTWSKLQHNGMTQDFGWGASAVQYGKLYQALTAAKATR